MIAIQFGGADTRSLGFLNKRPDVFIAHWLSEDQAEAMRFIGENWVAKGGRGFFGATPEFCEDVRASGIKEFQNVSDEEIYWAIHYAVSRIRNYAHIERLQEGAIKLATIVADGCQTPTCQQLHGKTFSVRLATMAIDSLMRLSGVEQGLELAKRVISAKRPDLVPHILNGAQIKDEFVLNNYAFPSFYPGCQCRVEGVIEM